MAEERGMTLDETVRWFERMGFQVTVVDEATPEEAGKALIEALERLVEAGRQA